MQAQQPVAQVGGGHTVVTQQQDTLAGGGPVYRKTVTVQHQGHPVHPFAFQPFDFRKFLDFSFITDVASKFGAGAPFGFERTASVQHPHFQKQPLVSYSVQKTFQAPAFGVAAEAAAPAPQPQVTAAASQLSPVQHSVGVRSEVVQQQPQQQAEATQTSTSVVQGNQQVQLQQTQQQEAVPNGGYFQKTVLVSPLAPKVLVAKKHHLDRVHNPKQFHLLKGIQIQQQ